MIGRADLIIPAPLPAPLVLDASVRALLREWPNAVVVDGDDKRHFQRYRDVPFHDLTEVMVFKNASFLEQWRRNGANPQNVNSMINLIWTDSELTIVVDDPADPMIVSLVEAIKSDLRQPILNIAA